MSPPDGAGCCRYPDRVSQTIPAGSSTLPALLWKQHWVGICAVALILASETKFVLKGQVTGAGSSVDFYILMEVAAYSVVGAFLILRSAGLPSLASTHPLELLPFAYVCYMAVLVPFAPSPVYSAIRVLEMVVLLLLMRAAVLDGPDGWFLSFARIFVLATVGLVVIGLALPHQRGPLQVDRFNWLATHSVVVGQFLALAFVAALVLTAGQHWRGAVGRAPRALVAALLLVGMALVANNTRGSAAGAAAGAAVALFLVLPRRLMSSVLLVLVYVASLLMLASGSTVIGWLTRGDDVESLGSLNSRLPLWQLALSTVAESNPLFGLGIGASRSVFYDETGLGGAHNAALNVFVDLGIVGVVLWSGLILYATWVVFRAATPSVPILMERALWLSTMTVLVVNGTTAEGLGGVASVGVGWLFVLVARAAQLDRVRRLPPLSAGPHPLAEAHPGPRDRTGR